MYEIRALSAETWEPFAELVDKHNGVFGGCWCTWFHADTETEGKREVGGRAFKRRMVEAGIAHAALVFDDGKAIGWAEYGSAAELPRINHRKEYEAHIADPAPYRVTCFFVDRDHRRAGVARAALSGVLALVAAAGGGTVEGYPREAPQKRLSSSFLATGTRGMFENAGFHFVRPLGAFRSVMRRDVAGS